MNKKLIRLTESDLHSIIKESIHNILSENKTLYDYYESDLNRYTQELSRYNEEYEKFKKTGTVSHEFLVKLLSEYKNMLNVLIGTTETNMSYHKQR